MKTKTKTKTNKQKKTKKKKKKKKWTKLWYNLINKTEILVIMKFQEVFRAT